MSRLAEPLGVDLRTVSAYESGEWFPPSDKLADIAEFLNFPAEFFFGPDIRSADHTAAAFRSLSSMTAYQRNSAMAAAALAFELNTWIEARFHLPEPDFPDLRSYEPEAAAETIRTEWGLGQLPIRNVVHLLEAHGVRAYSLVSSFRTFDAYSIWQSGKPFVFFNTIKSGERGRYDGAHELGHFLLHRHGVPGGRLAEQQADVFAAALLMPKASVLAAVPSFVNLDILMKLKRQWNVSVAALARRLRDLGVLSEWHYRNLAVQISQRGFRTNEPEGIPRESSQVLKKVFDSLRTEGISIGDVAKNLRLHPIDVEELVFGLVLIGLPGGAPNSPKSSRRPLRPALRLIKTRSSPGHAQ